MTKEELLNQIEITELELKLAKLKNELKAEICKDLKYKLADIKEIHTPFKPNRTDKPDGVWLDSLENFSGFWSVGR